MHEFFCLNVDDNELLAATSIAAVISDLIKQETTLYVNSIPHFAKYVNGVNFCDDISGELWMLCRRKRKIQQGLVDGKTNLWLGHHRGHYFDKDRDPLVAAVKITKEYINSVGLRKRVTKAKFAKFIHVDPAPLAPPISFMPMKVCLLPNIERDLCQNLFSTRDIYGFYNSHVKNRNAVIPQSDPEWVTAVQESDIIVTRNSSILFFFLSHLRNKKIIFVGCSKLKGVSRECVEVTTAQELIREIREVRS